MTVNTLRLNLLFLMLVCLFLLVLSRLYYWQVFRGQQLSTEALDQYQKQILTKGSRGGIYTSDGYPLVVNKKVYRLFLEPQLLDLDKNKVGQLLLPILLDSYEPYLEASDSALKEIHKNQLAATISGKLEQKDAKWVSLFTKLDDKAKDEIEKLSINGLGFDEYEIRDYPQASLAAQITGFVGKDETGQDTGYFGIEGALNKELEGEKSSKTWYKNIFSFVKNDNRATNEGRDVILTIRRDIQFVAQSELEKGLERYNASSGEIIIMEPKTGKILALASAPKYNPIKFYEYDPLLYKNPAVANTFEPGSIFKVFTLAAGLDTGVIKEDTKCPSCAGPVQIGKYTIRTWNNEYNPDITMTEALAKSDNTAMIYIANLLGEQKFQEYIKKFGISKQTTHDLQEDKDTPYPNKWGEVELATRSFGQGITTTSLQMVRALGAIANQGQLMQTMIVDKVIDPTSAEEIIQSPQVLEQVVSKETALKTTQIMIHAAQAGEAQWTAKYQGKVAAKTGTAQIAVDGKYDEEKTIASYIGFAPADDPQFVMLVKLVEPKSSPWASETAAPLWYKVADSLFLLMNIAP